MSKHVLKPRPNLFFDGDVAVIDWFYSGVRNRWIGPQALLIRDNGTPTHVAVTKLQAEDFIHTVGVYNYQVTEDQLREDIAVFWVRNIGVSREWK